VKLNFFLSKCFLKVNRKAEYEMPKIMKILIKSFHIVDFRAYIDTDDKYYYLQLTEK